MKKIIITKGRTTKILLKEKKNQAISAFIFLLQPVHIYFVPSVAHLYGVQTQQSMKKRKKCDEKKKAKSKRKEKKSDRSKVNARLLTAHLKCVRDVSFFFLSSSLLYNQTYMKIIIVIFKNDFPFFDNSSI
jgi:hypothetical protein